MLNMWSCAMPDKEDREGLLTGSRGKMRSLTQRALMGLSITQVVMGSLAIAAEIVVLTIYWLNPFTATAQGIWCGVAFIVCGVIGIITSKRATRPWVTAHLIFSILSCLFSAAIITLSILTSTYNFGGLYYYDSHYYGQDYIDNVNTAPYWNYPITQAPYGGLSAGPGTADGNPPAVYDYPGFPPVDSDTRSPIPNEYYDDIIHKPSSGFPRQQPAAQPTPFYNGQQPYDTPRNYPYDSKYYTPNYDTYDTYPNYYYQSWNPQRSAWYYHRNINVQWVVQFSMNMLMALLGLISAIVAVISATLSCVPLCCDPIQKYLKEQQDSLSADSHVVQFDQADSLPIKTLPDMQVEHQSTGHVTKA